MAYIVFTGKGFRGGVHVTRDVWSADAQRAGHYVFDTVEGRNYILVASRDNTTKARAARNMGCQIMTYAEFDQFIAADLERLSVSPPTSGSPAAAIHANVTSPAAASRMASDDLQRVAQTPVRRHETIRVDMDGDYFVVRCVGGIEIDRSLSPVRAQRQAEMYALQRYNSVPVVPVIEWSKEALQRSAEYDTKPLSERDPGDFSGDRKKRAVRL